MPCMLLCCWLRWWCEGRVEVAALLPLVSEVELSSLLLLPRNMEADLFIFVYVVSTCSSSTSLQISKVKVKSAFRTPGGVYGRSLSLFQWREATWEFTLPSGQDVSQMQGTSPAWQLVLICSWVDWSYEKLKALLNSIPRGDWNSVLPGQVRTLTCFKDSLIIIPQLLIISEQA